MAHLKNIASVSKINWKYSASNISSLKVYIYRVSAFNLNYVTPNGGRNQLANNRHGLKYMDFNLMSRK